MEILPTTDESLSRAHKIIKGGGVVVYATETCYGLACDMTNMDVVKNLFAIKNRPGDMPVSALFSSVEEAKKWVEWNVIAQDLAEKYLPGPLTIVLNGIRNQESGINLFVCPKFLIPNSYSIGIRISSHPVAQRLSELCQFPISTTSANLHGEPNPYSAEEIVSQFSDRDEKPDLVLDSGELPKTESSTVVIIKDGTINVARQGSTTIQNSS